MRLSRFVQVLLVSLCASACETVLGIDFDAVDEVPDDTCRSAQPNVPPEVTDAGGSDEITVVTTNSRYGDGNPAGESGYLRVGYDVDATCTGRGDENLCTPPAWIGANVVDGPNGEDNGVGRMFVSQKRIFNLDLVTSDTLDAEIVTGRHAPTGILRVRGYNGFHEDDTLEVDWFVPLAPSLLGDDAFVPAFDGSDVWPISSDDLDEPEADGQPMSVYRDEDAYVNGYQLVARFPRIRIPIANIYFEATKVIVSGDIVSRAGEGTKLENGLLAGIVSASTLLEVLPVTTEAITGQSLCNDDPLYPSIKRFVCISADTPLVDGNETCDGASFGIAFQPAAITLGSEAPVVVLPSSCTKETTPRGDTCAIPPDE